jgi:hypothetical protein
MKKARLFLAVAALLAAAAGDPAAESRLVDSVVAVVAASPSSRATSFRTSAPQIQDNRKTATSQEQFAARWTRRWSRRSRPPSSTTSSTARR